ncbi:hypothetical protein [Oryzibacter oryziterrae]|uniref:hypothetical protein n=1 Tax=Oryzibacter oryziterrae TaxID=2766474 RepID=UPI001F3EE097|nr:hypothetical protein [Oryzibacter oryziterrae]
MKQKSKIVDLLVRSQPIRSSIIDRIERRITVLSEWVKAGVPQEKHCSVPKSLRAAKDWEDPELGISRIASPNDFTQRHPVYGTRVREIARLLTELNKSTRRPGVQHIAPSSATTIFDKQEAKRQLEQVVSQWHSERHLREIEQKRTESAQRRAASALQENAELRRKLAVYERPAIIS